MYYEFGSLFIKQKKGKIKNEEENNKKWPISERASAVIAGVQEWEREI